MIRILLDDDQVLLRPTFRMMIGSCDDMTVVAEAANGEEAIDLARRHHPDLVLTDIRMPVRDGLAATREICSDSDLAGTRVLILTTFETDDHVARALRAGASGVLGKDGRHRRSATVGPSPLTAIRIAACATVLAAPAGRRRYRPAGVPPVRRGCR